MSTKSQKGQPLSQPARQQLARVYSDLKNNSSVAQRKSGLLRWIQSSAFDPIKGIHLPVSEIVETNAAAALNRSKNFACTLLNFPEMPPVPRFFSNALMVGTENPSLRGTNAGLIIVTHEIDTENLAEFEEVLAWTRGAKGDFNKSPFAELDRRLCECHEYRGYSIVYSGRRSLHFHFFFQTKHFINAPWEAKASPRKDAGPETAALMQNVHNLYWDHARTAIGEILDPPRPVDPQMRSLTKWRRMPWAIRVIEEDKDCSFLNLRAVDKIPQLVINEHIRGKTGKNSTWLVLKTFSTCHPLKFASKAQAKSTDLPSQANIPEIILLLQEQCRQEWGSEFPKPVKFGIQDGQPIIKFKNHEGDKNPSSFVLGDYRKLVIQGNNGQPGDWFLPDHITAAEFTDFTARRCGATKVPGAAWTSPAPAKSAAKFKGRSDFLSQMLTAAFYRQTVIGDITGIRNHQRELLRREVGYMRDFHGPYLMKSAEGFGKTSSHFPAIQDEMFDIASAQPWGSPALFGCFAFRSYQQAEEKANEFRQHPECNRAAVIKSFNLIYREFCEQEGERPIDRVEAEESTHLAEIRTHQPKVFDLLEDYRTTFWAENKFSTGATTLFTTHATIQSWHEGHFTRLWHHPKFDPESPDPQRELRNSFVIAEVVFDELEIDEFVDCLPDKLFRRIRGIQKANPGPIFDTGVAKKNVFDGRDKLPEERRHLMHEGVHIEQAVLERCSICQNRGFRVTERVSLIERGQISEAEAIEIISHDPLTLWRLRYVKGKVAARSGAYVPQLAGTIVYPSHLKSWR